VTIPASGPTPFVYPLFINGRPRRLGRTTAKGLTVTQGTSTKHAIWAVLGVALLLITQEALSQVYRCTTPDGSTTFSDRPCATDAEIHKLPKIRQPAAPPHDHTSQPQRRTPTAAETRAMQERERRLRAAERSGDAEERVRQIRTENFDAAECAAARLGLEQMRQRDPIGWSISPRAVQHAQNESLYCGPDQPIGNRLLRPRAW